MWLTLEAGDKHSVKVLDPEEVEIFSFSRRRFNTHDL